MPRTRLLLPLPFAFALLSLVVAAHPAAAQRRVTRASSSESRSRVDTTIAFDKNGTVTINAGNGDIFVTGGPASQLHVRGASDDDNIRFVVSGSSVDLSGARRGGETRFEITVPYGARVVAKTQSGDISVRGTRGEVEATAQNGDVRIDEVNGRLDVKTFSGDVIASNIVGDVEIGSQSGDMSLTDVRGNIEIGNTSGDVIMKGVTARVVRARTVSGDVSYDGTIDPAGRYELVSHSGDVHLRVPRDASAQLTVSTWNGEILSDFPITLKPGEHDIGASNSKRFTFSIGGGAARISAETFSGDVAVSSNGRGAGTRP